MRDLMEKTGKRGRPKFNLKPYIKKMESYRLLTPELEERCLNFLFRLITLYGVYKVKWWLIKDEKVEKLGVSKMTSLHWEQTPLFRLSPEDMKYLASIVEKRYEEEKERFETLSPQDQNFATKALIFDRNTLSFHLRDSNYCEFLPSVTWNASKKECDISYNWTKESESVHRAILSTIPNIMPCSLISGETEENKKRKGVELAEKFNLNIPELEKLEEKFSYQDTSVFYFHTGWTKDQWDYCEEHLGELKAFKKLKYSQLRERMMSEENIKILRSILDYPEKINEYLALVTVHLFLYYASIHKQWDSEFILEAFHEVYKVFPWYEKHASVLYNSLYRYLLGFNINPNMRSMFQKINYLTAKQKCYSNAFFKEMQYDLKINDCNKADMMVFAPLIALRQLMPRMSGLKRLQWKKITTIGPCHSGTNPRSFFEKDPSLIFTPLTPKEVYEFTKKIMITQVSEVTPEIARFVWLFEKTDPKVREEGLSEVDNNNNNEPDDKLKKTKSNLEKFIKNPLRFLQDAQGQNTGVNFNKNIPFDENFRYVDTFYGLSAEDIKLCKTAIENKVLAISQQVYQEEEREEISDDEYKRQYEEYCRRFEEEYANFEKCSYEEYVKYRKEEEEEERERRKNEITSIEMGTCLVLALPSLLGYFSVMTLSESFNPKYSRGWFGNLKKSWEIARILRTNETLNTLDWDPIDWITKRINQINRRKTTLKALFQNSERILKGVIYVS